MPLSYIIPGHNGRRMYCIQDRGALSSSPLSLPRRTPCLGPTEGQEEGRQSVPSTGDHDPFSPATLYVSTARYLYQLRCKLRCEGLPDKSATKFRDSTDIWLNSSVGRCFVEPVKRAERSRQERGYRPWSYVDSVAHRLKERQ